MAPYTPKSVLDVADSAPALGVAERQETRFASADFAAEDTGFGHHILKPRQRQTFGHRTSGPRTSTSSSPARGG